MAIDYSEAAANLLPTFDRDARRASLASFSAARAAAKPLTMSQIYAFSALFWLALFGIHTTQMMVATDMENLRTLAARAGLSVLAFVLSLPLGFLIRRSLQWPVWRRLVLVGLACMPSAIVYAVIGQLVWRHIVPGADTPLLVAIAYNALYYFILFVLWCAFCTTILIAAQLQERERSLLEAQSLAHHAELKMLRYQINPHFLFNTLNAVSALIVTGQTTAADEMVGKLSRFFRNALSREATAKVPLAEDVRVQLEYLSIELTRFPDRLSWSTDIESALERALVPHLILQPLFENAIKHGVARSGAPVEIRISASAHAGQLRIRIANDVHPTTQAASSAGEGVGLVNVKRRLESFYGEEAGLTAAHRDGRFVVELRLPLEFSL